MMHVIIVTFIPHLCSKGTFYTKVLTDASTPFERIANRMATNNLTSKIDDELCMCLCVTQVPSHSTCGELFDANEKRKKIVRSD